MQHSWSRVALFLWTVAWTVTAVAAMDAAKIFSLATCTGTPYGLIMEDINDCEASEDTGCTFTKEIGNEERNVSFACNISDRFNFTAGVFGDNDYVVIEYYDPNSSCKSANLTETDTYRASGDCMLASSYGKATLLPDLHDNGSIDVYFHHGPNCSGESYLNFTLSSAEVEKGDCIDDRYKVYTSYSLKESSASSSRSESSASASASASATASATATNSANTSDASYSAVKITSSSGSAFISSSGSAFTIVDTSSGGGGISIGAIAGIVAAVLVVVVFVVIGFLWYRQRTKKTEDSSADKPGGAYAQVSSPTSGQKSTDTGTTDFSSSVGLGPQSLAGLWDDELIATSRIPREKVLIQQLISRGGYGEVYYGLYSGQRVALKMLPPELRKSIKHVNELLDEVRLLAMLDHPRIVHFVGISWDSLSDLCVVLEYMEGGDLRALLASYESQSHEVGFDRIKVTIALHVAHALTYLHSLDPPVLHRDLKSKNILLSSDLQAKVTDFGISRESADKTMTAGVGTSLWMAPEVMMGERYDGKADMFSFGVVLSELDLHTLPYAHAKENSDSGRKMPDTAILQMVALGKIRVQFSSGALESMVALGKSCVAVDPKDRPTAAEALYYLQTILRQDL